MEKGESINKLLSVLLKDKLDSYNKITIEYNIKSISDINNLLVSIKTLIGINYKLTQVQKKIDTRENVITINKKNINSKIYFTIDNIFHTYNENSGFVSYDKYKNIINNIISVNLNNVIIIEKNEKVMISESYNNDIVYKYLEYQFILDNGLVILLENYYGSNEHYRLKIEISIEEEKYISSNKIKYINDICNKVEILMSNF
jgi:hypothetical protein